MDLMEIVDDNTPDVDDIVDDLINKFNRALNNPQRFETSGRINTIEHLLTALNLNDNDDDNDDVTSDQFHEIIEEIIPNSNSNTFSNTSSNNLMLNSPSDTQSTSDLNDKPSKSSTVSFFLRLLGRKKLSEPPIPIVPSIPSVNSANNEEIIDATSLQAAQNEIDELIDQGPAGLVHLSPLSHVVNRRIQVWTSSMDLYHEAGRTKSGEALNIQFHSNSNGIPGHWTLLYNKDPQEFETNLNDCLFDTIASQTGRKSDELRLATIERMKQNIQSLANRIQVLAQEHECGRIILMIGGARYRGTSSNDAKRIIDSSQNGRCHPGHIHGHARGHASNPSATTTTTTTTTDNAENYSRNGWKTAFPNQQIQNNIAHQALINPRAQKAMEQLNNGGENRSVRIPATEFNNLPTGIHFNDGIMGRSSPIKELVLVLRHHAGHANHSDHDVFVHTFYPVLEN